MATSAVTERELIARIETMRRGQSTIYYTGHLATDAFFNPDVAKLRDTVQRLSTMLMIRPSGQLYKGMGIVTLTQRKVGDKFEYRATKV
jgi:hypothetical protein